jgi:phospholipid/cholesterol/gamma-HCH transport system substrate-binding protein
MSDITSGFAKQLGDATAQLERATQSFEKLSHEWTEVGNNVNALLQARGVSDVDSGSAVGNLATVLARVDARLAEMKQVLAGVDRYVNDEELRGDIKTSVRNVRTVSDSVAANFEELTERYVALADDMSATVASARQTIDKAGNGDGTLGRMLMDPALYNNLNDAAQRLQRAIDEIRLLAQKWKDEGLPVQF